MVSWWESVQWEKKGKFCDSQLTDLFFSYASQRPRVTDRRHERIYFFGGLGVNLSLILHMKQSRH